MANNTDKKRLLNNQGKYPIVKDNYDHVDLDLHHAYDSTKEFDRQYHHFIRNLKANGHILVVGPTTQECDYFDRSGYKVSCIDISINILKYIERSCPNTQCIKANVNHCQGDVYDAVWACRSLIHIPPDDLPTSLTNISNLLLPNGIFGSIWFTNKEASYREEIKPEILSQEHVYHYRVLWNPKRLLGTFTESGFKAQLSDTCYDSDKEPCIYIQANTLTK